MEAHGMGVDTSAGIFAIGHAVLGVKRRWLTTDGGSVNPALPAAGGRTPTHLARRRRRGGDLTVATLLGPTRAR